MHDFIANGREFEAMRAGPASHMRTEVLKHFSERVARILGPIDAESADLGVGCQQVANISTVVCAHAGAGQAGCIGDAVVWQSSVWQSWPIFVPQSRGFRRANLQVDL